MKDAQRRPLRKNCPLCLPTRAFRLPEGAKALSGREPFFKRRKACSSQSPRRTCATRTKRPSCSRRRFGRSSSAISACARGPLSSRCATATSTRRGRALPHERGLHRLPAESGQRPVHRLPALRPGGRAFAERPGALPRGAFRAAAALPRARLHRAALRPQLALALVHAERLRRGGQLEGPSRQGVPGNAAQLRHRQLEPAKDQYQRAARRHRRRRPHRARGGDPRAHEAQDPLQHPPLAPPRRRGARARHEGARHLVEALHADGGAQRPARERPQLLPVDPRLEDGVRGRGHQREVAVRLP
jgi:hypothetical protein